MVFSIKASFKNAAEKNSSKGVLAANKKMCADAGEVALEIQAITEKELDAIVALLPRTVVLGRKKEIKRVICCI